MRKAWNYLLAEPFTWIFYAIFQPSRLERDFVPEDRWQSFILMLRMIVPMFLLIPSHLVLDTEIASVLLETAIGIAGDIVGDISFTVGYFVGGPR